MSDSVELETRRMGLRGIVRVASEVLPPVWPMRSFVHHNPLHGFEDRPFDVAVRQGERLFGGRGYLPAETYRAYLRSGRIGPAHLDHALQAVAGKQAVAVGERLVGHLEVLKGCMTHGLGEEGDARASRPPYDPTLTKALVDRLAGQFAGASPEHPPTTAEEAGLALARTMTLATWCDRRLGTEIQACVNNELVKWCGGFLDEGHATWPMPGREQGLFLTWRSLAGREWRPGGISGGGRKIRALSNHPEDVLLESLERLGVPEEAWEDYLALELAALPGWSGFIKWRAEHRDYPWQQAYPASLVKYLAMRLWYERELVAKACRRHLAIEGNLAALIGYASAHPAADAALATPQAAAQRLLGLASSLDLTVPALLEAAPGDLATLLRWVDDFPPADRDAVWLRAFEAGYQEALLAKLDRPLRAADETGVSAVPPTRPLSQSVYCLDVRTEPFRRHLEAIGDHETYAFAGFFGAAIRFRPWETEGRIDQVPAVMQPRNEVREVPRSYHEHLVPRHRARAGWLNAGHTLLGDLKDNVVTPYVMVESLGWFYGVPLVGKTLVPGPYRRLSAWVKGMLMPTIPTVLTVDKLAPADVEQMVAAEQRDTIWKALRARFGHRGYNLDPRFVEAIRLYALGNEATPSPELGRAAEDLALDPVAIEDLVAGLRRDGQIEARSTSRRKEKLTRTGFTIDEQVATLENVLRTMGLTQNFARLVLICAHGSTSENNPYESALDCGACGGNHGSPNARTVARMANNLKVRERLARVGIVIPTDSHFLAGQLDTTTDAVRLYDLEDVPPAHRKDVARLQDDLALAGRQTSEERLAKLPDVTDARRRPEQVKARSADWSQVRPEWGLSGNAAFVIGPRALTKGIDLGGRVFLHSYDARQDPSGRLLEVILTAGQLVAQWINMEHYFSSTDHEVYGSGSKAYHNVVGRVGVMSGPWSDLRMGLARQTVSSGEHAYHEPMRLVVIVAASRRTLEALIARHLLLQQYYHHEWVHLIVWDPDDSRLYRYGPGGGWTLVAPLSLEKEPIA
ncbi:MAG: hypothetical protein JWM80_981 [Cyanobacteria bacterium RYN_339]|nr:hypothetical protein [Cyanobacteria bacterium RYN_339]